VKIPFLHDFPIHVTYLIALSLRIIAEAVIEPAISLSLSALFTNPAARSGQVAYALGEWPDVKIHRFPGALS
jgi:hypothetical protein